jgi:hypothetical protein
MKTNLPYIVEGEIVEVQKRRQGEREIVRYTCLVKFHNGSNILLPDVQEMTMFGGIADYFQRRARASKDEGANPGAATDQNVLNDTVGDRVYISFINGDILKPVIIGWAQHPQQVSEFKDDPSSDKPRAVFQYAGVRVEIDETGQFKLVHKGAPAIKDVKGAGGASGALSVLEKITGPLSPAVVPTSVDNTTIFEMLDDGVFRIRDADGQIFEIDRTKKRIFLANNSYKSIDPANLTGNLSGLALDAVSDYVKVDGDEKSISASGRKQAKLSGGGASINLENGKVALGNKAAELLDLVDQIVTAIQSITVGTGVGTSTPPLNVATFTQIQAKLALIKGSL